MKQIILNRTGCALLMCVPLLWTACSREKVTPATSATETHPADPPGTQPPGDATAVLNGLTQVLRKYSFEKRRVPATVEELVTAGYVRNLPPPPAGKKFVIDEKRVVVELANQ